MTKQCSAMQIGLVLTGLAVVGAMEMVMHELFSVLERQTTAFPHCGSQTQ